MAYLYNIKTSIVINLIAVLSACSRNDYAPYSIGLPENVIPINSSREIVIGPRAVSDNSIRHGGGVLAAQTGVSADSKSNIDVETIEVLGGRNIDDIDSANDKTQEKKVSSKITEPKTTWNTEKKVITGSAKPVQVSQKTAKTTIEAPHKASQSTKQASSTKIIDDKKENKNDREKKQQDPPKTVKPVDGKIVSKFGSNDEDGIEFAANLGQKVVAFKNGTIKYRGHNKDWGNLIIIKHDGDLMSVYAYLKDMVGNPGDIVKAGQKIGTVGKSIEDNAAPRLYFQILKNDVPIDPEQYF